MTPLGIDLGTSTTSIAQLGELLEVAPGGARPWLLPSAVAHLPSGETRIGAAARGRRAIDPVHTLTGTKRLIGARAGSSESAQFEARHPNRVVDREGRACLETRAGVFDPSEIAATILEHAARAAGVAPKDAHAVVTVPASFGEEERAATLEAAHRAGFAAPRLVAEPVATALAYLARSNLRYAAVYDLGGGTFDLAIVDCLRYPFRVIAYGGDAYLGGEDIDRGLALRVAARVLEAERWDLADEPTTFARLVDACEWAKLELGVSSEVSLELAAIDPAGPFAPTASVRVAREELIELTGELTERSLRVCDDVLARTELRPSEVDAVFLAGGATALPGLEEIVGAYFGKRPRMDLDPQYVVARGASLAAARPDLASVLETSAFAP